MAGSKNDGKHPGAEASTLPEGDEHRSLGGTPTAAAGAHDSVGTAHTFTRAGQARDSLSGEEQAQRYEELGELGRGGQSVVRRAWDLQLEREVAIKELKEDASESARERFLREARVTARLEHPNIVPVYEIGRRADGTLYCVQKLIRADARDGQTRTLRRALQESKTLDDRLRLLPQFLALCQGIGYAHAQGVLHRDLKPENVVLGQFGETVILDWGLAREKADAARPVTPISGPPMATVAGAAYGTPAYMSPEQANGETVTLDERSDLWSLGVMLFELLTGRTPFAGKGAMEVVEWVRTAPVPEVRTFEPRAPPELAAVAHRALERDRTLRFASARELADEISAWQSGNRVSVYSYSAPELARLFVTRHRAVASVALAAFVAVAALAGVAWARYVAAREALSHALVERARSADRELRWNEAALLYAAARVQDDNPETQWGVRISGSRRIGAAVMLPGHRGGVRGLAFSPDGSRVATAAVGGQVRVFRTDTWALEGAALEAHDVEADAVGWTNDGRWLLSGGADGYTRVRDAATRLQGFDLGQNLHAINRIAVSKKGAVVALALEVGAVEVRDVAERTLLSRSEVGSPVYGVALDPNGPRLALVTWDSRLEIRGLDGALLQRLTKIAAQLQDVKYSPDGRLLATAGSDKVVRLYPVSEDGTVRAEEVRLLTGHERKVYALAFSPDSTLLASGSTDRTVRFWRLPQGQARLDMSIGGSHEVQALAFSPGGDALAVGTSGDDVEVHRLPMVAPVLESGSRHEGLVGAPGVPWVALPSEGGPLLIDPATLEVKRRGGTQGRFEREITLSRDGTTLAWLAGTRAVKVMDTATLHETLHLDYPLNPPPEGAPPNRLLSVGVARDGSWIAAGDGLGEIRLFKADGAPSHKLLAHTRATYSIDSSPDGTLIASASYDHTARLWSAATGEAVAKLEGHVHGVRRVRFSPDGKTLASTGWDRTVRLWDVATRRPRCVCVGHEDHVFGLDWSPDSQWVASGGRDGTLRIWNAADCRPLAAFASAEAQVYGLVVWGDGLGLAYSGFALHTFRFSSLKDPPEQLRALEKLTGQRVRGYDLEPLP